jgi:ATP phosphoribosyltransferase regulatory subunit HisZ
VRLTDEERLAIQAAAEADGYSEMFTDLLCRFAELIGTEEVLGELKRLEPKDTEKP